MVYCASHERVMSLDSVYKRATQYHGSLTGRARRESRVARDSAAGFHRPRLVRHPCSHGRAIQFLTAMRLWESNYLLSGRTSREGISALRCTNRRPPSPDDRGRWRTPEVDRVPGIRSVQRACARCSYFIHAIEGHYRIFLAEANLRYRFQNDFSLLLRESQISISTLKFSLCNSYYNPTSFSFRLKFFWFFYTKLI